MWLHTLPCTVLPWPALLYFLGKRDRVVGEASRVSIAQEKREREKKEKKEKPCSTQLNSTQLTRDLGVGKQIERVPA